MPTAPIWRATPTIPRGLEAHLATRTPAWAAAITGLSEDEIVGFARLYGRTKRSYIRVGYGFSRSRNGAAQLFAVSCLPAVTGAWAHEGGGALYSNLGLVAIDHTLIEGLDRLDPTIRILDQSRIGPVLTGDPRDLGNGPPVTALFVQNTNPMVVAPESRLVHRGFARSDLFVCVHEQFMTETAAMADIVLPATTFLEHDDLYLGGAHTYLQLGRAVLPPYAECRSNHDVINGLAERLGARHPGFAMSAVELIDRTLQLSGLPGVDELPGRGSARLLSAFRGRPFSRRLPAGRQEVSFPRRLVGDRAGIRKVAGVSRSCRGDRRRRSRAAVPPGRRTLALVPQYELQQHAVEHRPRGPADRPGPSRGACRAGARDGDRVRVGNRQGSLVVHARGLAGMQKRVVIVEGLWPNHAFEEGIGINLLTSADPGLPRGGAVFHDTSVWLSPA